MKKVTFQIISVLTLILMLFNFLKSRPSPTQVIQPGNISSIAAQPTNFPKCTNDNKTLLENINILRTNVGLSPLTLNEKLNASAQAKNDDMIKRGYWAHFAPDGTTPWDFMTKANYKFTVAGENLARGYKCDEKNLIEFMKSPTHRENILGTQYTDIGFGRADTYLTVHFGKTN